MNVLRTKIFRLSTTSLLLASLVAGFFAPVLVQRSPSVLALWLADKLSDETNINRADLLEEARQFSDSTEFFYWAAEKIRKNPSDFDFPIHSDSRSEKTVLLCLQQDWDARMSNQGMAAPTTRIEPLKQAHFDSPSAFLGNDSASGTVISEPISASVSSIHLVSLSTEPLLSGISIGAP